MSMHFSQADQYYNTFRPTRLKNWQVPKWYPEKTLPRTGYTKFIANSKGHIHVGRVRIANSFGYYTDTWDMPLKITRAIAEQLSSPADVYVTNYLKKLENYNKRFGVADDDEIISLKAKLARIQAVRDMQAAKKEDMKEALVTCTPCMRANLIKGLAA